MLCFWSAAVAAYEHQPIVPALHFRGEASADFTGKNDTWYELVGTPEMSFAARTMATTLLLPRPQMVKTTLPTDVRWSFRLPDRSCRIEASASVLSFSVACENREQVVLNGPWKQFVDDGVKAYMRASILHVRLGGWEMNATRRASRTQVAGSAPWRYDLTARPLLPAEKAYGTPTRARGLLAEAFAASCPGCGAVKSGAHDDYGERVDGFRYDVVTTRAAGEELLRHAAAAYELGGNSTDLLEMEAVHDTDVGWY